MAIDQKRRNNVLIALTTELEPLGFIVKCRMLNQNTLSVQEINEIFSLSSKQSRLPEMNRSYQTLIKCLEL